MKVNGDFRGKERPHNKYDERLRKAFTPEGQFSAILFTAAPGEERRVNEASGECAIRAEV
jgi:hypothetical protein